MLHTQMITARNYCQDVKIPSNGSRQTMGFTNPRGRNWKMVLCQRMDPNCALETHWPVIEDWTDNSRVFIVFEFFSVALVLLAGSGVQGYGGTNI